MKWCDITPSVQEWGSEEIIIPYISLLMESATDIFLIFMLKSPIGSILLKVKPLKQTKEPKTQKRHDKTYINEVVTYAVNQAKWKKQLKSSVMIIIGNLC